MPQTPLITMNWITKLVMAATLLGVARVAPR